MSMWSRLIGLAQVNSHHQREKYGTRESLRPIRQPDEGRPLAELLDGRVYLSADPVAVEQVGHWGGTVETVAVSGTLAYACQGQDLLVVDVSVPSAPSQIGMVRLPGFGRSVSVVGSYAYVANDYSGLQIIDISNSSAPVRVGEIEARACVRGVSVAGDYAYVADDFSGLQIINIGNKSAPVRVSSVDAPGRAFAVSVVGNYAYVADYDSGLQIVDIRNPAAPVLVGAFDTAGSAYDVSVVGSLAYVADGTKGLQVIDISTPSAPVRMDGIATSTSESGAHGVRVVGGYAYVADDYSGLQIIDIRSAPLRVGGFDTPGSGLGVSVVGDYAYVAAGGSGLQIIDISNPNAASHVGGLDTANAQVKGLSVVGNYAYVVHEKDLEIIDIRNPSDPVRLGEIDLGGYWDRTAQAVKVVGNYAYVACGNDGLKIIDIRDPATPVLVGGWSTFTPNTGFVDASDLAIVGNYAYVLGYDGLWVLDISLPTDPALVKRFPSSANSNTYHMYGICVVGDTAYIAASDRGLWVIDIQDSSAPYFLGGCATTGSQALGVSVVGDYAYVAGGYGFGLQVIDIRNSRSPVRVGGAMWMWAKNVSVVGTYAYVRHASGGLGIFDVSTPSTPVLVGEIGTAGAHSTFDTTGEACAPGMSVVGNRVYLADENNGLVVLRTGENQPPTDLVLSAASISEDRPLGTVVGSLAATDLDGAAPYTYGLVAGDGSMDNASFGIVGNTLKTKANLNYEAKSGYAIRVRVTDQGGLWFEKALTINVTNVNEKPTGLALSKSKLAEGAGANATIGTLSATDPNASNTFTYTLVSGTGSADNALFAISGNTLKAKVSFDYETKSSYSVRVRVTDAGGLSYEKAFAIGVTNVAETECVLDGTTGDDTLTATMNGTLVRIFRNGALVSEREKAVVSQVRINGLAGNDTITLPADFEMPVFVYGGDGNDTITGGAGNDTIYGNSGEDVIRGGGGNDSIMGGIGADSIDGQDGDDRIWGGDHSDTIRGGAGNDYIEGKGKADLLYGDEGDDTVLGMAGNDTMYGNFGDDSLMGLGGDDSIMAGLGADWIDGGTENDRIWGGDHSDTIYGGAGNDYIEGKGKADTINGGDGSDTLLGQAGSDLIHGDGGDDWIYVGDTTPLALRDTAYGGEGFDRVSWDDFDSVYEKEMDLLA